MTLREKIMKLLEVPALPHREREVLDFAVTMTPEGPLEDLMFPDTIAHIEGRYEWFYNPQGLLRRSSSQKKAS